jgi:hypothetical protein
MPGIYDESPPEDVTPMTSRALEHAAQVDLIECAIFHALEKMRAQRPRRDTRKNIRGIFALAQRDEKNARRVRINLIPRKQMAD